MDDHDDNAARSWFRSKFMHRREYPQGSARAGMESFEEALPSAEKE